MSRRYIKAREAFPLRKGECRVCLKPMGKRSLSSCSDACRREVEFFWRIDSQRAAVYRRDKGVCQQCGLDTEKLKRVMRWTNFCGHYAYFKHVLGLSANWEMDHIIPVSRGGGLKVGMRMAEAMANLRTLCVPCHKARPKPKRRVA